MFEYTISTKNEVTIRSYSGTKKVVQVPQLIDGRLVTRIAKRVFSKNQNIEEVILPDSIKRIGPECFRNSKNLKSVRLSNNIETLPYCAFDGCTALEQINIPDAVEELEHYIFEDVPIKRLHIGKGLKELDYRVLQITDISFEDMRLKSGSAITKDITELVVDEKNPYLCALNSFLLSKDKKLLLLYVGGQAEVIIPEGIEVIAPFSFIDQNNLKKITIPNTVHTIGKRAFSSTRITHLEVPPSVKQIEYGAFKDCINLERVDLVEGIETIGHYVFEYCDIKEVYLPKSLIHLAPTAFQPAKEFLRDDIAVRYQFDEPHPVLHWREGLLILDAPYNKQYIMARNKDFKHFILPKGIQYMPYNFLLGNQIETLTLYGNPLKKAEFTRRDFPCLKEVVIITEQGEALHFVYPYTVGNNQNLHSRFVEMLNGCRGDIGFQVDKYQEQFEKEAYLDDKISFTMTRILADPNDELYDKFYDYLKKRPVELKDYVEKHNLQEEKMKLIELGLL